MDAEDKILNFISKHEQFADILLRLRDIIRVHPFEEAMRWGVPTYRFDNQNLVGIGAFKNHVGLWFFQGSLLSDPHHILKNAQQGKTKAMRQIRFRSVEEIDEKIISAYLKETLENQKKGLLVKIDRTPKKVRLPIELITSLEQDQNLSDQFYNLTPGRQNEYANYIAEAKRMQTKSNRLIKIKPLILDGKGLYDKYKNC